MTFTIGLCSSRSRFALLRTAIIVLPVICLLLFRTTAKADINLVANGDFTATSLASPGGYFCEAGASCVSNVAGWGSVCKAGGCGNGSTVLSVLFSSTNGAAFNGNIGLWAPIPNSPGGGNIVAGDSDPAFSVTFSQPLSGLTQGDTYALSFEQAAAQQLGARGATTARWQVTLGSQTEVSALMNTPSEGFSLWNGQSLTFQATSSSEILQFLALGTPSEAEPVALLGDVSLVAAPEPSGFVFMGIGLLVLVVAHRRMKRRS